MKLGMISQCEWLVHLVGLATILFTRIISVIASVLGMYALYAKQP